MAAGALSAARAIARLAGLAFLMTASANAASPEIVNELAPGGRLRAAINYGNPVLAQRDAATGALGGVTVDLARELGRRLKVAVDLVPFDTAGKVARLWQTLTSGTSPSWPSTRCARTRSPSRRPTC